MSFIRDYKRNTIAVKTHLTQQQKEHIWQLMCEKVAGIISPKDQRYLESQIISDEDMREAYDSLSYAISEEDNLNADRLQQDEYWRDIFQVLRQQPRTGIFLLSRQRPGKLAIAAIMTGLLLSAAGIYFFSHRSSRTPVTKTLAAAAPVAEKEVLLQLADSRSIPLSGKQSHIDLGDVRIYNNNQSLSFESKDGADVHGGQHTLIVPAAKDYKVTLADGTEIWLNAASRLQFPFSFNGNSREITLLSGEAYVDAATDPGKPFIIHTAQSTIQVLGTSFNINAYDRSMVKVSLVSGAVKMNAGHGTVTIKPGQEAVYRHGQGLKTQPFDEREVLSWRSGKHFFVNAPMSEICTILQRNMGITAVIDSASPVHSRHFSGVANKHRPVHEFLEDVKNMTGIDYYFDRNGVLHFK